MKIYNTINIKGYEQLVPFFSNEHGL